MATTTQPDEVEGAPGCTLASHEHSSGLLVVGLFKLSKALFFGVLGLGALHMVHRDLGALVQHLAETLRLDSETRLINFLMDRADLITNHQLRKYSVFSLSYAAVCLVESVGLLMEKTWAEYFTLILTICAMPWELFEIYRKPSYYSLGLLLANIAILIYLVWFLRRKGLLRRKHERLAASAK